MIHHQTKRTLVTRILVESVTFVTVAVCIGDRYAQCEQEKDIRIHFVNE